MKFLTFLLLLACSISYSFGEDAKEKLLSGYFDRPLNCPLRFSNLSQLRDQVQTLTASLGGSCTQSGQQALNQLNSSTAALEGIANSWNTFQGTDSNAQNAQLAKNAGQVLGSLNIITSNNECFYDIRSRGTLPVISDIIMSLSQVGLLIPNATGMMVATGGYIAGAGLRIINELVKKKFNWNRPEERRAFLQLNCAFFDNRKVMEEMGLFNPETKSFREKLMQGHKVERLKLVNLQKENEAAVIRIQSELDRALTKMAESRKAGLNPLLKRKLEELVSKLASRPVDYSEKWKQVSFLALNHSFFVENLTELMLDGADAEAVQIMLSNLLAIEPDLKQGAKAWTSTIDEYEILYRGPVLAFASQISQAMSKKLSVIEAEMTARDLDLSMKISELRVSLREAQATAWGASQRLLSVESKIRSLEESENSSLFSYADEGTSDAVEILDYYRKLQRSILGKEGKGYLKHAIAKTTDMEEGLTNQIGLLDRMTDKKQRCAAAEKLRFAWAQYRFKVQEAYDFVATNLDLYRSSFRIGKERQRSSTNFVLHQIASVEGFLLDQNVPEKTVGHFMNSVNARTYSVETKLQSSGCF